jgi:hypothetical protein
MTDIKTIREDAVNNAKIAVDHDNSGNVEEAFKFYLRAAEKLKYLSTIDENTYNRETYKKKAIEYCERAQALKTMSKEQEDKKQPVVSGGGGG